MTLKPLNVLKKGLSEITKGSKVRRDELNAKLARKASISSKDEHWLEHVEPRPTRRDVLKATSTIIKYTNDLNDPLARRIETLLGSFNRQLRLEETRNLKDAVLSFN